MKSLRNWLRRWLGITDLEDEVYGLDFGNLSDIVDDTTYPSDAIEHREVVKGYEQKP